MAIKRIIRDRPLTPEEVARDTEIRRQVEIDFPPSPLEFRYLGPDEVYGGWWGAYRGDHKVLKQGVHYSIGAETAETAMRIHEHGVKVAAEKAADVAAEKQGQTPEWRQPPWPGGTTPFPKQ